MWKIFKPFTKKYRQETKYQEFIENYAKNNIFLNDVGKDVNEVIEMLKDEKNKEGKHESI